MAKALASKILHSCHRLADHAFGVELRVRGKSLELRVQGKGLELEC